MIKLLAIYYILLYDIYTNLFICKSQEKNIKFTKSLHLVYFLKISINSMVLYENFVET